MTQIIDILLTIEKATGLSVLQTTFIIPLASCLGTSETALLQILANEDEGNIQNCLDTIKSRTKKSSLFQYLFSNGAEVDDLTNTMSKDI